MELETEQIDELRPLCKSIARADEGGFTYLELRGLQLPDGCQPALVDALLCPMEREGYSSRLFFAERISSRATPNWNASPRVLERNWQAFSWRTPKGLRLAQMVATHLGGLR
jgi:hypothetical protein